MKVGDIIRVHMVHGTRIDSGEDCPFYGVVDGQVNEYQDDRMVTPLIEGWDEGYIIVNYRDTFKIVSPSKVPDHVLRAVARRRLLGD